MATTEVCSPSPRVSQRVVSRAFAGHPITPVHSPHPSITSSTASRTPSHTLTLHEYHKQQNTPIVAEATTLRKTLRRKAAAEALKAVESAPLLTKITTSGSSSSLRPLHLSQSVNYLQSDQRPPRDVLPDSPFRPRSAKPHVQSGITSSVSTVNSVDKVRSFNTRKRLPRPPAATGPVSFFPPLENRQTAGSGRSQLPAALSFSLEDRYSSEAQTTPTHSTISLSRFPKPPCHIDPFYSWPYNELGSPRVNALSYSTNAPATPPATPATIHHHGTLFDLINPHDSLLLHDIVTPSQQFGSSEHLLSRTSEEFFAETAEMAHKRPLYGDIDSARAGIMRQPEDAPSDSDLQTPLQPAPTAVTPNSTAYTSPLYSPESAYVPSPLAIGRSANDSRFSLKQLTRSLTKKIGRSPIHDSEEELQEFSSGFPCTGQEEELQQPPAYPYVATLQASYFPPGLSSPMTATGSEVYRAFGVEYHAMSPVGSGVESSRRHTYSEEPLASLIPDDPSTQVGRMSGSQALVSEQNTSTKPYYDDLDSIYPSSSVYTGDDRRQSYYQESLNDNRQSKAFLRFSSLNTSAMASEYNRESSTGYGINHRQSHQSSGPSNQESYHHSVNERNPKTDTISKLIDEYSPANQASNLSHVGINQSLVSYRDSMALSSAFNDDESVNQLQHGRRFSEESHFEIDSQGDSEYSDDTGIITMGSVQTRRPAITRDVGLAPLQALPLSPSFEYDEAPFVPPHANVSGMFSNDSAYSYGDTQNLLQMCQSEATLQQGPRRTLEPSSSYSQTEAKVTDPCSQQVPSSCCASPKALDEDKNIFRDVVVAHKRNEGDIPAMWARRSSGNQLLSKKIPDRTLGESQGINSGSVRHSKEVAMEKADWETIGGNSRRGRDSLDSLADYSSSESGRNSLEHDAAVSLPAWDANHPHGLSRYSHHNRIRSYHRSTFASSPPGVRTPISPRTEPALSASLPISSPSGSSTVPRLYFSSMPEQVMGRGAVEEPFVYAPWANPYAMSDKETQELLASGPNENIIFESDAGAPEPGTAVNHQYRGCDVVTTSSPFEGSSTNPVGLERINTFEKFSVVGPLGNLTGTPHGTGMQNAGSSIADNSSPGLKLSSKVERNSMRNNRNEYSGFYATPFKAVSSITPINQPRCSEEEEQERPPSQITLFPRGDEASPTQEAPSPLSATTTRRQPLRSSTTFHSTRRMSRSAVPGQTRLRQMFLAGDGRATASSQRTNFSRLLTASDRPSTSDTNTPLYPSHLIMDAFPNPNRKLIARQNSPHLLCPERETNAEDEARRRKLSWAIFAAFCLLPPCIILFRFLGDSVIASITKGRLGHTTAKAKRTALIAGFAVNIGLIIAILLPILIAHALHAL